MGTANLNVFVSYSHADRGWLKVLDPHLKPLARDGRLDLWDDRRIKAGRLWREEIQAALERADVAILLLSPNYFASDFIASNELPPLLEAAHHRGLQILGLHIAHSLFDGDHVLSSYQTVNRPSEPLESLRKPKRDVVLVGLARQVKEFAQRPKKPPERSEGMSQRRRPDSRADTSGSSDQTYFPYLEQFTPNLRSASAESHLRIFDYSYAPIGRYNWRYEVKSSEALLSDWFHEEHGALVELQDEWGELLGKKIHLWKGEYGSVDVRGHPYLKRMYPFIAVSRVDRGKLWGAEDPKSRIVLEFLTWVRKLCKADTESEFVLTGLAVNDVRKYMYLVGDFLFRKIETRAEIGSEWSIDRFKLDRQLIVVECGWQVYIVSTGIPHPSDKDSDYTAYVRHWLSDFQLGHR